MVYVTQNSHYSHVNVKHVRVADIENVMGINGEHFKTFTSEHKLKYVWWRKDTHVIELWGPFERMENAHKAMSLNFIGLEEKGHDM